MLKEFNEFLQRGNVLDLAVAVVIGSAFNSIIDSLVNDLLMPIIGLIIGGIDFSSLSVQVGEAVFAYGNFIQAIVNFVIIAFTIFLVVRTYNRLRREEGEDPAPLAPSAEEVLLTEIRDLLEQKV